MEEDLLSAFIFFGCFETLGAVGTEYLFNMMLAGALVSVCHAREAFIFFPYIQRLSVAIQRDTAACIMSSVPHSARLDEQYCSICKLFSLFCLTD